MDELARWRAYICCGPTCTLHRSPALLDVLQHEVDQAGLSADVEVMPGGCMKHCERGPSMAIWPGPVYYEHVDTSRLRRIVREHLRDEHPIREWFYRDPGPKRLDRPAYMPGSSGSYGPSSPRPAAPLVPSKKPAVPYPRRPERDVDDFQW